MKRATQGRLNEYIRAQNAVILMCSVYLSSFIKIYSWYIRVRLSKKSSAFSRIMKVDYVTKQDEY